MNRTVFNVFLVVAGAAIGSAITWKVVTTKYEKIVQEEIDSVKEEFKRLYEEPESVEEVEVQNEEENELIKTEEDVFEPTDDEVFEYHNISSMYRSSENDEDENDEEGGEDDLDEAPYINGPYVISPYDFRCSPPGYNAQALDYYSDGVLADSWGTKLDIEETIGEDSLNHFGEYADDILYVRNERKEIDYEVTYDLRTYKEVYDPHMNA